LLHDWVDFDAVIGNPPYMGAKRLKQEHDSAYINEIRDEFPDVPGNADYCVYWFRKTHDNMHPGDRAGLVGTNTIRQNYSRMGGLDYIVANDGVIYDAISSMPWSGEAVVHVSVVNWSKGDAPVSPAMLHFFESINDEGEYQFRDVKKKVINSSLSEETDVSGAKVLRVNKKPKRVFQGQIPGNEHFVFEPDEARAFIKKDSNSVTVLFPFLIGDDLVGNSQGHPSRLVLDLNQYDAIEAQQFGGAYAHIKKHILPVREEKAQQEEARNALARAENPTASINRHHRGFLNNWWKHSYGRNEMWSQLATRKRFVGCSQVTKRPIFDFISTEIHPDVTIQTFIFDDDYSFGILQSNLHWLWFTNRASTLKSDYRYTPTSVFNTFPFPQQPDAVKVRAVADAGRALHEFRRERMAKSENLTLRDMYRTLELPGNNPLKDLHQALDEAV
ncbi:MAG: type IIL restriction-modification enzyme MmeI, partial [Aggregatilineales bacterium]